MTNYEEEYRDLRRAVQEFISAIKCTPEGRDLTLPAKYRAELKDGPAFEEYKKLEQVLYK